MAIKIPQNQIKYKYTSGGEYTSTTGSYQGYYYEMNGKAFAGNEFNPNAPLLIPISADNTNFPSADLPTLIYEKISGLKIKNENPFSLIYNYSSEERYFIYQINKKLIKETDENTFNTVQVNPLFTSVKLSFTSGFNDKELELAEQKIPGITLFVNTSYTPPPIEDDGTIG